MHCTMGQDAWCTMGKNTEMKLNGRSRKPEELEYGSSYSDSSATRVELPIGPILMQESHAGFVYICDRDTNTNLQTSKIFTYILPNDKWNDEQKSHFHLPKCRKWTWTNKFRIHVSLKFQFSIGHVYTRRSSIKHWSRIKISKSKMKIGVYYPNICELR